MGTPPTAITPKTVPWADRGEVRPSSASATPRSARDLEILRSLAKRIKPDDTGAHNNLGVVYYNKGLYAEAIEHFEHALELDPRMQVAERNLQIAYFGTGFYEGHVAELLAQLEADPNDVDAHYNVAAVYASLDRAEDALAHLDKVLLLAPAHPKAKLMQCALKGTNCPDR